MLPRAKVALFASWAFTAMTDQQHLGTQQNIVSTQTTTVDARTGRQTNDRALQVVPVCLGVLRW